MPENKRFFSYIRVSTQRQGQTGTSLAEQQSAIERYAAHNDLTIIERFEEKETAAKQGRPAFLQMLRALQKGQADGVIIHKIDRSARNLKDWADLGDLIDAGIKVHFASESLDLDSRGGRLSADIQAVVASDFIRNLRQEVKKGFYGRLKQGLYPRPAPIGYLNTGKGQPKTPDPVRTEFIKQVFGLYATGNYSIKELTERMYSTGFRTQSCKKVTHRVISRILRNCFYTGLVKIEKTGEIFKGIHRPIVSSVLFDKVQNVLSGKIVEKRHRHFFLFRRLLVCNSCLRKLIGERQKGHLYYRCHTRNCPQKTIREPEIERAFVQLLQRLRFNESENRFFRQVAQEKYENLAALRKNRAEILRLQLEKCRTRLSSLTDLLVDGLVEPELFRRKKNELVKQEKELEEEIAGSVDSSSSALSQLEKFLELVNQAYLSYNLANPEEKRELVKFVTSNFSVNGKTVLIKPNLPFAMIENRPSVPAGRPSRLVPRTFQELFERLFSHFSEGFVEAIPKAFGNRDTVCPKSV